MPGEHSFKPKDVCRRALKTSRFDVTLETRLLCNQYQTLFSMLLRNVLSSLPNTSTLHSVVGGVVGGVVKIVAGEPTVELDYGTFKGNS